MKEKKERPSFYNISWPVTEEEYRADPALSYSTISKYERTGFDGIKFLFDKVETPSLTFGSAVDSLITGGKEEFDSRFLVADFPALSPSMTEIVKHIFHVYGEKYDKLTDIPDDAIILITKLMSFQLNWKAETRARVIKESGSEYYRLLFLAKDKTVLDAKTYEAVLRAVKALKTFKSTYDYFKETSPFENVERLYQLKFKAQLDGTWYRCMADLIVVDHDKKTVQPIDLKTSSKREWDFHKSFIDWRYDIQARLYWRLIRTTMDGDPYFKDFKLLPYKFIVVNRNIPCPLVWGFAQTTERGTLKVGKNGSIELRDPCEIGAELDHYLTSKPTVPVGIIEAGVNDINTWLNKL
jgi:hypothetical protein